MNGGFIIDLNVSSVFFININGHSCSFVVLVMISNICNYEYVEPYWWWCTWPWNIFTLLHSLVIESWHSWIFSYLCFWIVNTPQGYQHCFLHPKNSREEGFNILLKMLYLGFWEFLTLIFVIWKQFFVGVHRMVLFFRGFLLFEYKVFFNLYSDWLKELGMEISICFYS